MDYLHSVVNAGPHNIVEVTLDKQARVMVMDGLNYSAYRSGRRFPLTEGKCYPAGNGLLRSRKAKEVWEAFKAGDASEQENAGSPGDWFQLFGPQDRTFPVWEQYLPIPILDTVVVLLTVAEAELFPPEDDPDWE